MTSTGAMGSLTPLSIAIRRSVHRRPIATPETVPLIFFLFLQAPEEFVKCRSPELIGWYGEIFFRFLDAWLNPFVGIVNTNRRFEVLDKGSKSINSTALLALSLMLIIFVTPRYLFAKLYSH
jgi:hypothetical protein